MNIRRLTIDVLRESCDVVLGWRPESVLIGEAYREAELTFRGRAKNKGWSVQFSCGNCGAPAVEEVGVCWACGLAFRREVPPERVRPELERQARSLGVEDPDLMTPDELVRSVREAEERIRLRTDRDLLEWEARSLNAKLRQAVPDDWVVKEARTGTTYFDPGNRRRIFVPHRGISVLFSVRDGEMDGRNDLVFYEHAERQRRHLGRSNYQYEGDLSREVLEYCFEVVDLYRGEKVGEKVGS